MKAIKKVNNNNHNNNNNKARLLIQETSWISFNKIKIQVALFLNITVFKILLINNNSSINHLNNNNNNNNNKQELIKFKIKKILHPFLNNNKYNSNKLG